MIMTLAEMKNVDVRTVDPATLADVQEVTVNTALALRYSFSEGQKTF